jgi:thioredoxin 1
MIKCLEFSAIYCNPCKILSQTLNKIQNEYPNINIESIDIDDFPELAKKYNIKSLPTLIFYKDNNEVTREIGNIKIDKIREIISQYN